MTDKQIIINDVDVSGCKHFKIGTCLADYCLTDMPFSEAKCELNPNCYYKQLKRKEQECKVLALDARVADNHLQHRIEMCDLLREKLKAKEQECDKLKFNLKGAGILGLMKRNVQLKKALDKIEKICQIKEENSQFVLPSVWQQILEIINKVKESE